MKEELLVKYNDVDIYQQELCVLEKVNLELRRGEFIYLIGKVGSGKSTLIKTLYADIKVDSGRAEVLGYDMLRLKNSQVPYLRRKIGVVFQDFKLLTDRRVNDNLEFVLKATGWKGADKIKGRVAEVLELVGMKDKGYKYPHELSGGEQQRIAIARAMLNNPDILIADEPTGNLDEETSLSIIELLHDICQKGALVVVSTHNAKLIEHRNGAIYRCSNHKLEKEIVEQNTVE
ncbi:MAG: ATP-binding cassette domain-containing protein [Bacteroides sp.]|nr:ATP-binding cassette domain-containing protein [Bacteroides sp.]